MGVKPASAANSSAHPLRTCALLAPLMLVFSCTSSRIKVSGSVTVGRGVVVREIPRGGIAGESDATVIEVDLAAASVRVEVVAENVRVENGRVYGDARTVTDWCGRTKALAGINGGFFGVTRGSRKEVIGLLAANEIVMAGGRIIRSPRNPSRRFVRSVFGFDKQGRPRIGWAVGQRGRAAMLTEYLEPLNPVRQRFWTVDSAVACGPRLIRNGKIDIADSEERLVSPGALRRTFAAYSIESGRPRHLILGIADSMTFKDVAAFLDRYFRNRLRTACHEAMCLDGGASTQLVHKDKSGYKSVSPLRVSVPTAILVLPRRP